MRPRLDTFVLVAAVAAGAAAFDANFGRDPGHCPAPSPKSVEALFAPCIAPLTTSAEQPAIDPMMPNTFPPAGAPSRQPRPEKPDVVASR